jgi:penicillin amidase
MRGGKGWSRLAAAAGIAGAGALGAAGARRWFLTRPLPPRNESVDAAGLDERVEILFDRWGVPHIYAANEHDAAFAQGYVHARDRLWQMELNRRLAKGELAEILGPPALPADRFLRRLGFRRAAEAALAVIEQEDLDLLDAYCAGVGAYVARHKLPVEFTLLRLRPRAWRPEDGLAFGQFMAFTQTWNWESELIRARLIARFGPDRAAEMEAGTVAAGVEGGGGLEPVPVQAAAEAFKPLANLVGAGGSNNWVVSPQRSASAHALLANDPHLSPQVPGVWYAVHISAGDDEVAGVGLPGLPGVVIGHNARIAWGITSAITDTSDLFIERSHPSDASRFEFDGEWETARVIEEQIRVKGAPTVIDEVVLTRHGPLLNGTLDIPVDGAPLALKAVCVDEPPIASAIRKLNQAGSWHEFQQALRGWTHPSLNFVYADVDGNIGYKMAGRVPIRASGDGYAPVPGWEPEHEWTGYVPFEELPQAFNPKDGVFATANTRPAAPSPHFLTRDWIDDARWRRIIELLQARKIHDLEDLAAIQRDVVSLPGREVMAMLQDLPVENEAARQALAEVRGWDGNMAADSAAAVIYRVFREELIDSLFEDVDDIHLQYLHGRSLDEVLVPNSAFHFKGSSILAGHVKRLYSARGNDARAANGVGGSVLAEAFENAVGYLVQALGPDPTRWRWGALHQVPWRHPIGAAAPMVDRLLNLSRGPYPVGGDEDTPNQTGVNVWRRHEASFALASYRQLYDLADWDRSLFVLPPGQSGHPGSPHYDDHLQLWLRGDYVPLLFSRDAVAGAVEQTAVLRPV